jgi:hypothetical protein
MSFSTSNTNTKGGQYHSPMCVRGYPIMMTIYIPRVFKNIHAPRIHAIMDSLELGIVKQVDMVPITDNDGREYSRVFVHYSSWNDSQEAMAVHDILKRGDKVKIVYDTPWYWLISMSKPSIEDTHPKAFIDFSHTSAPATVAPATVAPATVAPATVAPALHRITPDGCVNTLFQDNSSSTDRHIQAPDWPPLGAGHWSARQNNRKTVARDNRRLGMIERRTGDTNLGTPQTPNPI